MDIISLKKHLIQPPELYINNLSTFRPLYNEEEDSDFNIYLLDDHNISKQSGYKNLTMNAFYQSVVKAIIRGYGKTISKSRNYKRRI